MNRGTGRHVAKRQGVARPNLRPGAGADLIADPEAHRSQDVGLLPVGIVQEGDAGVAIGVVFHACDPSRNTVLAPFEVDDAVTRLIAAPTMTRRDPTVRVATAGRVLRCDQGLLRLGLRNVDEV